MKVVWKGTLSFGLVSIPVELYTAVQQHAFGFTMVHDTCHTALHYIRWCEHCKKEVSWDEVDKGIKLADGSYFIVTKESLAALKPASSDQLSLLACIDLDALEPLYIDQHYYLMPMKQQEKAYYLLHESLKKMGKGIIAQGIFKEKEHICLIQPYQDIFLLNTLNYTYEIKTKPLLAAPKKSLLDPKELALAQQLLMKWYTKKFTMSKFKDTFAASLMKLIEQSKHHKLKRVKSKKAVAKKPSSLMHALKESLTTNKNIRKQSTRRAA